MTQIPAIDLFHSMIAAANADETATVKLAIAPAEVTSLKMVDHFHPWSITPGEFDYFRDFIVTHNLTRGYECATAFGVSALAAGLGMKATGGKLITLDAYIEEKYNEAGAYRNLGKEINQDDPDGLKCLYWMMDRFDLNDVIIPVTGWSPDNVAEAITDNFGSDTVDYAFIDAGHWDSAMLADALALRPFIDTTKPFGVFFHDLGCFSGGVWQQIHEAYGFPMQPITTIRETWRSGIVTNTVI